MAKSENLYKKLSTLREHVRLIEKEIENLGRKKTLKRLSDNVGKYFEHKYSTDQSHFIYVIGVNSEYLRNRVIEVGVLKSDIKDPSEWWVSFEVNDSIYNLNEGDGIVPSTKKQFDDVVKLIKPYVKLSEQKIVTP